MEEGPNLDAVVRGLQRDGHRVVQLEPRISVILSQPELDAIVIDAELHEPNPVALARHLANVLPDVRLCAVSSRPFASAWLSEQVEVRALIPEQLPALSIAIEQGAALDMTPAARSESWRDVDSAEFARRALGEIPELLARLEESVAKASGADTAQICELIERVAHLAKLPEMQSLARTLRVLVEQSAVDDATGFVEQLNRSFRESFPRLLAAQEN
jgi:hypothetical protein